MSDCSYDSLSIYDGRSLSSPLIAKKCGSSVPDDIHTSGCAATLQFITDHSEKYPGFSIIYTASNEEGNTVKCVMQS